MIHRPGAHVALRKQLCRAETQRPHIMPIILHTVKVVLVMKSTEFFNCTKFGKDMR